MTTNTKDSLVKSLLTLIENKRNIQAMAILNQKIRVLNQLNDSTERLVF